MKDGRPEKREDTTARFAMSALRAGDRDGALRGFDLYLEKNYKGPARPEILFFAGSLILAESIEVNPETGEYKVTDRAGHERAADLLIELCEKHPTAGWVEDAKDLLAAFFEPGEREGDEGNAEDPGRPPAGPGAR